MANHVESVKVVSEYLRNLATRNKERETLQKLLTGYANDLDLALGEIVRLSGLTSALPPDLGNIHDLPEELLKELSVAKADELEDQLVTVINSYGGQASLDQILVGLFRKFSVKQKRRFVQNKLYRMEMVWSVPGKKGVYTTTKPEVPDQSKTDNLFEGDEPDDEVPF